MMFLLYCVTVCVLYCVYFYILLQKFVFVLSCVFVVVVLCILKAYLGTGIAKLKVINAAVFGISLHSLSLYK